MIDTRFASGLTFFTTVELAGVSGGALPACFASLPVVRGGTVDSHQNESVHSDRPSVRRSK